MREVLAGGQSEGVVVDPARVHPLVQQSKDFALAGALDAGNYQNDRKARLLQHCVLRFQQRGSQAGQALPVGFVVDAVAGFSGVEHQGASSVRDQSISGDTTARSTIWDSVWRTR